MIQIRNESNLNESGLNVTQLKTKCLIVEKEIRFNDSQFLNSTSVQSHIWSFFLWKVCLIWWPPAHWMPPTSSMLATFALASVAATFRASFWPVLKLLGFVSYLVKKLWYVVAPKSSGSALKNWALILCLCSGENPVELMRFGFEKKVCSFGSTSTYFQPFRYQRQGTRCIYLPSLLYKWLAISPWLKTLLTTDLLWRERWSWSWALFSAFEALEYVDSSFICFAKFWSF